MIIDMLSRTVMILLCILAIESILGLMAVVAVIVADYMKEHKKS